MSDNRRIEQVICDEGFSYSLSQARRLVVEKAVKIDGELISEIGTVISETAKMIQVGKYNIKDLKK